MRLIGYPSKPIRPVAFTGCIRIGVINLDDAWAQGFSGVMVRGSGAVWDLRKAQPYECYAELDFDIPIGKHGDCYDRYVVRMEEMRRGSAHHEAMPRQASLSRRTRPLRS